MYGYDIETKANGKRFPTIEEIKEKSKRKLLSIPKNAFQKCFEDWKKLYIEGHNNIYLLVNK